MVVEHGLSCFVSCGTFPGQGLKLCLLHWQVDFFLAQSHQGSPKPFNLISSSLSNYKITDSKAHIKSRLFSFLCTSAFLLNPIHHYCTLLCCVPYRFFFSLKCPHLVSPVGQPAQVQSLPFHKVESDWVIALTESCSGSLQLQNEIPVSFRTYRILLISGPLWLLQPHSLPLFISRPHLRATQNFFLFLKWTKLPCVFWSLHELSPLPGILCPANSYLPPGLS